MKSLTMNKLPELPFDVSESLNQLRINLSFSSTNVKKVLITSSVPNEGKSFVAIGLWRSVAAAGKRALLIDCDLRMSEMRTKFDMTTSENFEGIAHLLSGQADIPDVVYRTNVPNGYILPVTNLVADPTFLLESDRFKEMLESCSNTFDYIILDCPPLGSVADALNISKYCDGSLLVVRSGSTNKRLVMSSVQSLRRAGSPLLGIVLNRVDTRRRSGSYYYKDYYSYGAEYYHHKKSKQK